MNQDIATKWRCEKDLSEGRGGAALNAGANEIAVEGVTLVHEGLKRV